MLLLVRVLGNLNLPLRSILLDVNGIEGMSFVAKDFLHLTKRSMFINNTNIFLLFTYNHARCFYNSV